MDDIDSVTGRRPVDVSAPPAPVADRSAYERLSARLPTDAERSAYETLINLFGGNKSLPIRLALVRLSKDVERALKRGQDVGKVFAKDLRAVERGRAA
jgi:hypothetical protein